MRTAKELQYKVIAEMLDELEEKIYQTIKQGGGGIKITKHVVKLCGAKLLELGYLIEESNEPQRTITRTNGWFKKKIYTIPVATNYILTW